MFLSAAMMLDWLGERHNVPACTRAAADLVRAIEAAYSDGTLVTVENGGRADTVAVTERVHRCLDQTFAASQQPV
jgi:3-isopropylmalate dehydrogenase